MKDAEKTKILRTIRNLFAILLTNTEIDNPQQLWKIFEKISEDFLQIERTINDSNIMINERHHEQALLYFHGTLGNLAKTLKEYNLLTSTKSTINENGANLNYYNTTEMNSRDLYYRTSPY